MKILAVDYGETRTGLAICDESELLATPLPQITEKSMNKVAAYIAEAAAKEGAARILLGLPMNMDGTEGARAGKSRRLAGKVEEASGLPVALWDERRTTITAAGILSDNGVFGQKRKDRLDSVSAAVWKDTSPGAKTIRRTDRTFRKREGASPCLKSSTIPT